MVENETGIVIKVNPEIDGSDKFSTSRYDHAGGQNARSPLQNNSIGAIYYYFIQVPSGTVKTFNNIDQLSLYLWKES